MAAAERPDQIFEDDPPALRTALAMLKAGLRPVPIHPGKKRPIGEGWGLRKHTAASLRAEWERNPEAGVGILLGDDGDGGGVIDFEVDDAELARDVLPRIFPSGLPDTLRFVSNLGPHYLLRYDPRLAAYGQTIIKGWIEDGEVKGNGNYLGVEFRIGTIDPASPVQEQTVVPPTPRTDGTPRQWVGPGETLLIPEAAFDDLGRILPIPESVFDDLDRYATTSGLACDPPEPALDPPKPTRSRGTVAKAPSPQWDAEAVKRAILPGALDLVKGWGLEITGKKETAKGFIACRAFDRTDNDPSAGFNVRTGVYTDRKTGTDLSIFDLAVALRIYLDLQTAINSLGHQFKVPPRPIIEGSDGFEGTSYLSSSRNGHVPDLHPWKPPRLKQSVAAEPFPLDVLPLSLGDLCREGANAVQCPADYFGAASLAFAGGVIGLSVNLMVKGHYQESPNLYLAIVGPPGKKKSPVLKILGWPLYAIDRDLREAHQLEMKDYKEERRQYESAKKKGEAGEEPEQPIQVQLTLDDTTREAVAQVHSENPRGLVLVKDELTSLVASLDAYRAGKGDDKQFWLKVNSGSWVKVNRKGTKDALIIGRPCITIVGGLTPDMLPFIKSERDDGWLDRILFAYPEPIALSNWTNAVIPDGLLEEWSSAIRRLWARQMVKDDGGRLRPYFVQMEGGAIHLWEEWINAHRKEQSDPDFPKSLEGPWTKMEGFAARLALILSQLHQAYDPTDECPPRNVSPLDIWGARKLADYFKAHFRRAKVDLIGRLDIPDDCGAMLKWLRYSRRESFSERDAKLNFPGRFGTNPLALSDTAEWLVRRGCIRPKAIESKGVGRPHSLVYEVNPYLHGIDPNEDQEQN
jgi:hypothetical protein